MIYHAAQHVATRLHAKGFPVSVRYEGQPVGARGSDSLALHFSPDYRRGCRIGAPPSGQRTRAHVGLSIDEGGLVVIAAASSMACATKADHQALAKRLVRAVVSALCDFAVRSGFGFPSFGEARFLEDGEIEDQRGPRGNDAVFVLGFSIASSIMDVDYDGEPALLGNPVAEVADPTVTVEPSAPEDGA